jgi:hypothetical protein
MVDPVTVMNVVGTVSATGNLIPVQKTPVFLTTWVGYDALYYHR